MTVAKCLLKRINDVFFSFYSTLIIYVNRHDGKPINIQNSQCERYPCWLFDPCTDIIIIIIIIIIMSRKFVFLTFHGIIFRMTQWNMIIGVVHSVGEISNNYIETRRTVISFSFSFINIREKQIVTNHIIIKYKHTV